MWKVLNWDQGLTGWLIAVQGKQDVALTGRNTTGPPTRAAPGELRCICECYRQRQWPLVAWPLHYV